MNVYVAETARRHAMHPKAARFTAQEMALWYHNWQPLAFVDEHRITAAESPEEIVALVHRALMEAGLGAGDLAALATAADRAGAPAVWKD